MSDIYIVGFDGTPQAQRAVDYAGQLAKRADAEVLVVFVLEWSPFSFHTPEELAERHKRREEELERAKAMLAPVLEKLGGKGVKADCFVRHGNTADLMCSIAKEKKATQIIIGRTGDSALTQRLLGGLVVNLAQVSPVPLTIVP